jgi:DNA-binding protein H-NS
MKLTLQELNEIYYCLNKTLNSNVPNMANKELLSELIDKVSNEISMKVYEEEQIEIQINEPRRQYDQWWEQNKERILAEDQLNHDMQFKAAYHKHGDY